MNNKYLVYFLFSVFVCSSQNKDEVKKILNSYDLNELKGLYLESKSSDLKKESLINNFLLNNPTLKRHFTSKGKDFEIVNIVDGLPIYITTDNASAATATKTKSLHSGGDLNINIEGQNMYVGVWDGGYALVNHVEYMDDNSVSRVTTPQNSLPNPPTSDHATHVMGTIIAKGVSATAKGMAPKATAVSYNWTNDLTTVTNEVTTNALLISNHSYGVPVINDSGQAQASWIMGCYDSQARSWDQLAYSAPYYLMVASAGNSGGDTYSGGLAEGYDKLTQEKNAKNNLVIANSNPFVLPNGNVNLFPINSSSSQGPADDGRIKPDLAGDGTNLISSYNTNTTSYATLTGTSMASPNVAGSLLLLQQYYNELNQNFMRASTLKGLACHTARDGGTTGPDAKFGWGLLDTKKAAQVISKDNLNTAIISEITLNQGEQYTFQVGVTAEEKLEASISWTDPAGLQKDGILNSPVPVLVNDLDLRITKDANVYFPYKLQLSNVAAAAITGDNIVDNIEKVDVANPSGIYTVTVSHKGNLSSGSQAFSLVVTGSNFQNLSTNSNDFDNIVIYPNPANDVLNFNGSQLSDVDFIRINEISGKEVYRSNALEINSIDVSSLAKGVYFLTFEGNQKSVTKKFIKK